MELGIIRDKLAEEYFGHRYRTSATAFTAEQAWKASWDKCLETLRSMSEDFDPASASRAGFENTKSICGASPETIKKMSATSIFVQGARYQHSIDQVQIQALKLRVAELEANKNP